ncbi:unnamed protein product [Parascedosporium putredinis]|uniref:Ankyrin repeat domain-containing protein n=1 Tax=Parascedosporium putredinis TaxID=1442378 RepID=A0A9P1GX65_9PEZI|nr:unnamed protein product [Parascedosporium putredinis]CAI7989527.1 unnamed protein product [Parascedosporium putredinis]
MAPNPYLLAADNKPELLPLLRENPAIASEQDDHGYSLLHAAASYNHLDLLRALVLEFKANVDIRDEDDETPLFVVETVEAARLLVEELGADVNAVGSEGLTARQRLTPKATSRGGCIPCHQGGWVHRRQWWCWSRDRCASPLPEGLRVTVGTMDAEQDVPAEVDPEFRRKIEELAAREDFQTPEGQAELRRLVEETVFAGDMSEDRNVRQKQ